MTESKLDREEYPGELRELRAVLREVAKHGCLACQLRASVACMHQRTRNPNVMPPKLRLIKEQ